MGDDTSRQVRRLEDKFQKCEMRGMQLIQSLIGNLEKLQSIQMVSTGEKSLPGRLSRPEHAGLEHLLLRSMSQLTEQNFENLRFCLEELEVCYKQLQGVVDESNMSEVAVALAAGNEYWRKRQLLETILVTDPLPKFLALGGAWQR